MAEKPRKLGSDSRMHQLSKEGLDQVNEMLTKDNMSYCDIQHWLEAQHSMKVRSNYSITSATVQVLY